MSAEKQPIVYPDFLAQRYEALRELGQGAYGIVRYLGIHVALLATKRQVKMLLSKK
jgi:hypothetical protein